MDKQKLMNAALAGLLGVSLVALPEEVEGSSSLEELSSMLAGGGCAGAKGGCASQRQAGRQIADNNDYQRGNWAGRSDADSSDYQRQGGSCSGKTADTSNRPRQGGSCAGKSGGSCAGKTSDAGTYQRPGSSSNNSNSNRGHNSNVNNANSNAQRNAASQRHNTWGNPVSAAEESPMNKGFDDSTVVPLNSDQMAQPRRSDSMSSSMSKPNTNMSKGPTGSTGGMSTMPGVDTGAAPSKGPGSMGK